MTTDTLAAELLHRLHAYWRAATLLVGRADLPI
jgi:hypothetical protein